MIGSNLRASLLGCLVLGCLSFDSFGDAYVRESGGSIVVGNDRVETVLDAKSGFVRALVCKETGRNHRPSEDGAWPLGVEVGYPQVASDEPVWVPDGGGRRRATEEEIARMHLPVHLTAEVRADGVQRMHSRSFRGPDGVRLEMVYEELLDNETGASTGVRATVSLELGDSSNGFRFRFLVENRGPHPVTSLYAGRGTLVSGGSKEQERLVAGEIYEQPRLNGFGRKLFAYTAWGSPSLPVGWMDYGTDDGGVGFAYVNPHGYAMLFEAAENEGGMSLAWRMFRNEASVFWLAANLNDRGEEQIYPLNPGETFAGGEWLVIPRAGDWHTTADAYRERYNAAFGTDRLTWETMSPALKRCDVMVYLAATKGTWRPDEQRFVDYGVGTSFRDMPKAFEREFERVGLDPRQVLAFLARTSTWGATGEELRYPDFFPVSHEAGGNAACVDAVRELRERLGVPAVGTALHLGFVHPEAVNYVAEADFAGRCTNPWYEWLGNSACIDNEPWFKLWKEKLIPAAASLGFTAVEFDEGAGNPTYCERPEHTHGASSLGILSQGMRSHDRFYKEFRRQLGPDSILLSEGGNDQIARWIDLHEGSPDCEVERYTHPHQLILAFADTKGVLRAFVNGAICILSPGNTDEAYLRRHQTAARLRKELREREAPGFPYGFRDTVGLTVDEPYLVARAYADERGITLVYFAEEDVKAAVTLDGAALGVPQVGTVHERIELMAGEAGYRLYETAPSS